MADFEEVLGNEFEGKIQLELWVADDDHLMVAPVLFGGIDGATADPRVQVLIQANRDIGGGANLTIRAGGIELAPDTPSTLAGYLREIAEILSGEGYEESWRTEFLNRPVPEED